MKIDFELIIFIQRSPTTCFEFLRDKDTYPQRPGSPVLVLDKLTPGSVGAGTRYREVVQMLPFVKGEIYSEVTRFEPPTWLEEDFEGAGMKGHLVYQLIPEKEGTLLIQREQIQLKGVLRLCGSLIKYPLYPRLQNRLREIKMILEGGWETNL